MGCTNSKIENEDNVARCKNRKHFMKEAVASRHALAAAHVAYIYALKNVGAAFREFGESDLRGGRSPLPFACSHSTSPPPAELRRSVSLPLLEPLHSGAPLSKPLSRQEYEDFQVHNDYVYREAQPPSPPSSWNTTKGFTLSGPSQETKTGNQVQGSWGDQNGVANFRPAPYAGKGDDQNKVYGYEHRENEGYDGWEGSSPDNAIVKSEVVNGLGNNDHGREMALVPSLVTRTELGDVLKVVDEWFMRAFESGKDMGRMLEALRLQYHSSFVTPKGFSDHSGSKIGRTMSLGRWSYPSQRMAFPSKGFSYDIEGSGISGNHASILDRLFAWEKHLYEEMKGAETIQTEYEKQCALLRRKNTKGAGNVSIDKTRATIKSLQSKIVIALQAVDMATKAIYALRDEQLYPQLLEILKGMAAMWNEMYDCHQRQVEVVLKMKLLEELERPDATSNMHRQATSQLELSLANWYNTLNKVINAQREYLHNVNSWLRLSLLPIQTEPRDRLTSLRNDPPLIYYLCIEWQQALDRLPEKMASEAIKSFSAVVRQMVDLQSDEVRYRKKADALFKELHRREVALENYERKHASEITYRYEHDKPITAVIPCRTLHNTRKAAIDALTTKFNGETEKMKKAIQETRMITINNFQTGLPSTFQAVMGFAQACSQAFQGLHSQFDANNYPKESR